MGHCRGAVVGDSLARILEAAGFRVQYLTICDARTLAPVERVDGPARVLAAAFLGRTRLIDNLAV